MKFVAPAVFAAGIALGRPAPNLCRGNTPDIGRYTVNDYFSMTFFGLVCACTETVRLCLRSGLALALGWLPLAGATLEQLSLDDMIQKSTAIVRGTVALSRAEASGPIIYTHYIIRVTENFKGNSQGTVDVAVPGGTANNVRQTFPGTPQFKVGDDYVFFLWTGRSGLTQIIGLTQGLFALSPGSGDTPTATRAASREVMLDRGTGHEVKDQTIVMTLADLRARIATVLSGGGK